MLQVDPMILDGNIKLGLGGSDGRLRRILLYFCSSTFFFFPMMLSGRESMHSIQVGPIIR